jgi:polyferredoxin
MAMLVAWPAAALLLLHAPTVGLAVSLFGVGLSLGPCLLGFALARNPRKQLWRRLVLATSALAILAFSLVDRINLDLDGFFELLLAGTMGVAIGHTMATTLLGPVFFGRLLCGWGCWRAMVLEVLPVGRGHGRRRGLWRWTAWLGLAASLVAAVLYESVWHQRPGGVPGHPRGDSVGAVAAGVLVYYVAAIGLALALRDQRAFCKYLCPTGLVLRLTSRRALLHVAANAELCTDCGTCTDLCPMDVPLAERVQAHVRIGVGDCILCQRCVTDCPSGALSTTFGPGPARRR